MPVIIYGLAFSSAAVLGLASYAPIRERIQAYLKTRIDEARVRLDDIFLDLSRAKLLLLHVGAPIGLGLAGWLMTGAWPVALIGFGIGLAAPKFVIERTRALRQAKFQAQFVDCLLVLSSCLRAGLSMTQSFSNVAQEMPAPMSQEFGLILKETRMGVPLDEAMAHFKQRMLSDDTTLFTSAVLVARQTGGDVTAIFTRLVVTLRERKKIRDRIKTLTFMAKMQGIVMSALPVLFSVAVYMMDRSHFDFFLTDVTGRLLLVLVVVLQLLGAFLFMRFSRSPL